MVVDITSPDAHGLEHFDGGEAKVVGHAGGQTVLDFGYGKTELFPSACCVACPWRTRDNEDEDSDDDDDDDDDASLSGDETASLGEEEIFAEKSSPPALPPSPVAPSPPSPPPVAPPAPSSLTLPASALPVSVPPSSAPPVSALPVSRILALEIAWFASPQLGGIEILEAGCLGSARSGGVCARLDALEHTLGLFSSPEPEAAPPTPANGGPLDSASTLGVPGRAAHRRQGHQPHAFRPQRQLSIALSARWRLFHVVWIVSQTI